MSGAGNDPAGEGPAGEDVLPALSPPRAVTLPAAAWYDGASFTFLYDTAGRIVPLHPVDHRVALSLLVSRGTLASVPALGAAYRAVRRIDARTPRTVERMTLDALASLLASPPAIRIERIDVRTRGAPTGGFTVAVSYTNLRARSTGPRVVTV